MSLFKCPNCAYERKSFDDKYDNEMRLLCFVPDKIARDFADDLLLEIIEELGFKQTASRFKKIKQDWDLND